MKKTKSGGVIKEYQKKGQGVIKRLVDRGLGQEVLNRYGTLDATEIVKSKRGLDNLKHFGEVLRQRPTIEKDIEKYNIKVEREKLVREAKAIVKAQKKDIRDEYGSKAVKSMQRNRGYKSLPLFENYSDKSLTINDLRGLIQSMNTVTGITHYERMKSEEIDRKFDEYFTEVKNDKDCKKLLREMKDYYKDNLVEFNDFFEYICSPSFKHDYDSDRQKYINAYGYHGEIEDRLYRAHDIMQENIKEKSAAK